MLSAKPNQPSPSSFLNPAPAGPADFACQALISLVLYLPYTSAAALSPVPQPAFPTRKAPKTAQFLCNVSHLESTLLQVFILKSLIPFIVEAGYRYSYGAILSQVIGAENFSQSPDIKAALGSLLPFQNVLGRVPTISLTGGSFTSASGNSIGDFGPYQDYNVNHTTYGNVTRVFGKHPKVRGHLLSLQQT
jgi:hypothetical protein